MICLCLVVVQKDVLTVDWSIFRYIRKRLKSHAVKWKEELKWWKSKRSSWKFFFPLLLPSVFSSNKTWTFGLRNLRLACRQSHIPQLDEWTRRALWKTLGDIGPKMTRHIAYHDFFFWFTEKQRLEDNFFPLATSAIWWEQRDFCARLTLQCKRIEIF